MALKYTVPNQTFAQQWKMKETNEYIEQISCWIFKWMDRPKLFSSQHVFRSTTYEMEWTRKLNTRQEQTWKITFKFKRREKWHSVVTMRKGQFSVSSRNIFRDVYRNGHRRFYTFLHLIQRTNEFLRNQVVNMMLEKFEDLFREELPKNISLGRQFQFKTDVCSNSTLKKEVLSNLSER